MKDEWWAGDAVERANLKRFFVLVVLEVVNLCSKMQREKKRTIFNSAHVMLPLQPSDLCYTHIQTLFYMGFHIDWFKRVCFTIVDVDNNNDMGVNSGQGLKP